MMNDMVNEVTRDGGQCTKIKFNQSRKLRQELKKYQLPQNKRMLPSEQLNALASELDTLSQEMHKEIKKFTF